MKSLKFLLVGTALCVSFAAFSQTDTTKKDTTTHKTDTTKKKPTSLNESESATTINHDQQATVSQSASTSTTTNTATTPATTPGNATGTNASSPSTSTTPKPNFGRYYIPVLGSYTASTTDNKLITVTADESNPGKIWIDGLTESKIYAILKAVPGTYKIPAQKQDENTIAEGTVMYNESNKQISLCVGCGFNEQAPSVTEAVATATPETAKDKKNHHVSKINAVPVVTFSGTKADQGTVSILQ